MKNILQLFIVLTLFTQLSNAQSTTSNYKTSWEKVHKFELASLPKSALLEVKKIYLKAKNDNNSSQIIKTLIYKSKFSLSLIDESQLTIVNDMKEEISQSSFPTKNILEYILADIYWQYYQQERWKIYQRTKTDIKIDSVDFRTWDLETLFFEISEHYQNSLENSLELQKIDLTVYDEILELYYDSKEFRPTLFDFIVHNALNFYENNEGDLPSPSYKFEIVEPKLLGPNSLFTSTDIVSKDSVSQLLQTLKLYKDITAFHQKDKNPAALIDLTIKRLKFVHKNALVKNKDSIYLNTLIELKETYKNHKISTEIDYEIAMLFNKQAEKYKKNKSLTYQYRYNDVLNVCNQAITRFPESNGALKCEALKNGILQPTVKITTEKFIPTNTPARLLINYSNTKNLYFTAFKISRKERYEMQKINDDSTRIAYINNLKPSKKWNSALRDEKDFRKHTTEVILPRLSSGEYFIMATPQNHIINIEKSLAYSFIQVTDLVLIENNHDGTYSYQVVDRNTGKPIKGAKVNLKNNPRYTNDNLLNKNFITDQYGQFTFKSKKSYDNVVATVNYNSETATFGNFYFYNRKDYDYNEDDYIYYEIKPFIFTDRSIYRPGQTVHFKVIALKKINEKTTLFTDEYIEVLLEDPNGDEVKLLDLKLNEFGSVSGEFILPTGGLTGEYTIYVDESYEYDSKFYDDDDIDYEFSYDSEFSISVEEYKRPKFETNFKPITETYKLNDSIIVFGNATAFAGSNITDAKVSYRVVRTANFPSWYYWNTHDYMRSESLEVTHGETMTDAGGNYEIIFEAIPDLNISKDEQPTFNYQVYADVTDINGETRSTETTVKVGYHSLTANIIIGSKIDKTNSENSFDITTNNLNNEFVATKGTVKIYKLKPPNNPKRNRPWDTPEFQGFTENKFKYLFPHDPYTKNENDIKQWKKGMLVYESTFDTDKSKTHALKNIKNWNSGKYIIVVQCKDKFSQLVKDEQRFEVFSSSENKISDNKLFYINTNKNTYQPNDVVILQIGSASKDITITLTVEKDYKIKKTSIIHLNNEIKTIKIPVTKGDIGGFSIKYHYVNYNSFKSGQVNIIVPYPSDNLSIETLTYRDKLQPGSKQTWSFKIKDDAKNSFAAEMLASMYDASLDEFKKHDWSFESDYKFQYSSYRVSSGNKSFGTKNFTIKNQYFNYSTYYSQKYDALDWFGFTFNNNRWVNNQYLNKIARIKLSPTIASSKDLTKKKGYVYGNISDESGPLPGVSVIVKGTTTGTETDFDGNYALEINKGEVLQFSFIGMVTAETKVSNNNIIDVMMTPESEALSEVIVTGFGRSVEKRSSTYAVTAINYEQVSEDSDMGQILAGRISGVQVTASSGVVGGSSRVVLRGASSITGNNQPLYVVDGVPVESFNISGDEVTSINILKGTAAAALYGIRASNGVIEITTKKGQAKLDKELSKIQVRKNLQETAFFYPHLRTDKKGNVSFDFTVPEALTRWKLQLFAHTKDVKIGIKTLSSVTQKELMVLPNPPRFLREGDEIIFSSKISNLTKNNLDGVVQLQLTDAITGKEVDSLLGNISRRKSFSIDAKGNTNVSWALTIPKNKIQALQYQIIAKAGDFSDGEQNVLPVLSNRMLVTETLPMWIKSNETKTFTLDKLQNTTSSTRSNHKLTLEITSNPAWYAIQALPYLMEYPYECAEQTFARYFANSLATHIANSNPRIQKVFNQWKSTDALLSNLEKNQELKSLIIQETPWLRDAQSETEQKKRIALLFDLNKMEYEADNTIRKLRQMQFSNGGFPWFNGSDYPNRYITQHIATGFGHLNKLGVNNENFKEILTKSVHYLDNKFLEDYNDLIKESIEIKHNSKNDSIGLKSQKEFLAKKNISHFQLQYLYMRSFYDDIIIDDAVQNATDYYTNQSEQFWKEFNLYSKGLIAIIQHRKGAVNIVNKILNSLKENSIISEEFGMYWKENTAGYYWYQSPVETQSLMIEVFSEIENDTETIDNLKMWLLKNKQTNRWKTTKATTDAVYALLLKGTDWLEVTDFIEIKIGNKNINPLELEETKIEAGTGYFKTSFYQNEIISEMATVALEKKSKGIAWGALYWQYFEDLDKNTPAITPLKISKKLFLKKNTDKGEVLSEVLSNTKLKLGDLIRVRIEIKTDRTMEFIHVKDMRASGFEPINVMSEYKYQDGLGYYESTKDASTNFFFDRLPKGVYVFEYDLRVNNIGVFSNGITTIQSMYSPEFSSHSEGIRVKITKE
ncbi:MAG: MG2 domain-containing protein [Urechidicola sp.]|nr:MG2 domain-containing protein [Urechidicola sp.]